MCDWRERPLDPQKILYARCDSHYLIPLWRLMRARLLAEDTEANREDAREELEVAVIRRHLAAQQRQEEALPSSLPVRAAGAPGNGRRGSGSGVAPESPVRFPDDQWTSEWDSPRDCHRRERTRSGSFFYSDLESINESPCLSESAADASGGSGDAKVPNTFVEEENYMDSGSEDVMPGGILTDPMLTHLNDLPEDAELSFMMDEDDGEDDNEDDYDDEDEDLWEGWGQAEEKVGSVTDTAEPAVDDGQTAAKGDDVAIGSGSATATSTTAVSPDGTRVLQHGGVADVSSVANDSGGATELRRSNSAGADPDSSKEDSKGTGSAIVVPTYDYMLHSDGVRLLWKTLLRTQVTAGVLWRPSSPMRREDAHKERHFRAAVQRLTTPRWSDVNVKAYEEVFLWRDRTARRLDDGIMYVCPADILLDVALVLPTTLDALSRISTPLSPVLGRGNTSEALELVKVVRGVLALPEEDGRDDGDERDEEDGGAEEQDQDGDVPEEEGRVGPREDCAMEGEGGGDEVAEDERCLHGEASPIEHGEAPIRDCDVREKDTYGAEDMQIGRMIGGSDAAAEERPDVCTEEGVAMEEGRDGVDCEGAEDAGHGEDTVVDELGRDRKEASEEDQGNVGRGALDEAWGRSKGEGITGSEGGGDVALVVERDLPIEENTAVTQGGDGDDKVAEQEWHDGGNAAVLEVEDDGRDDRAAVMGKQEGAVEEPVLEARGVGDDQREVVEAEDGKAFEEVAMEDEEGVVTPATIDQEDERGEYGSLQENTLEEEAGEGCDNAVAGGGNGVPDSGLVEELDEKDAAEGGEVDGYQEMKIAVQEEEWAREDSAMGSEVTSRSAPTVATDSGGAIDGDDERMAERKGGKSMGGLGSLLVAILAIVLLALISKWRSD